jgi:antitoxin MazE
MKALQINLRRIGNSVGIILPKPVLSQAGMVGEVEMTVERGAIVLRKARKSARAGWSEAARAIHVAGDDELLLGEFGNAADAEHSW